jgi:hypothetical protein
VQSNEAELTVVNVNDYPVAELLTPAQGTTYSAGTTLSFSGTANDEEDGEIPESSFSWQINFHHDDHVHDQPPIEGIKDGTFVIPDQGETSSNVWYRVILTVTDSDGLTAKDSVDVYPNISTITLDTDPPGLQLTLDGQPFETPGSVVSVEGLKREIGVVSPQILDDVDYQFNAWGHGGDESQIIITPVDDVTYTAQFSIVLGVGERLNEKHVDLYPNPAGPNDENVVVKIRATKTENVSVGLFDLLGRELDFKTNTLNEGDNLIPVTTKTLPNGVYGMVLRIGNSQVFKRLIVSR